MDCILRVIKGPDAGTTCRLMSGGNLVGRSSKAALKLTPEDISWEHLSVSRNGEQYIAENLSALGSYLDDARIASAVKLRPGDQIRLSKDTVLRLEALDGGGAMSGLGRKGLPILLLVLVIGAVAAMVMTSGDAPRADWNVTFGKLETWVRQESAARKLSAEMPFMLREAWRLESVEDYAGARAAWLRLKVLTDQVQSRYGVNPQSAVDIRALQDLKLPKTGPLAVEMSDEQMAAALGQFVDTWLNWATEQAKKGSSVRSHL